MLIGFKKFFEEYNSDDDAASKSAELYFSVGHGGYDEDESYIVWALINGEIETTDSGTHGTAWGHNITDRTWKGRYEPDTGKLSIVSPNHHKAPQHLMDLLHSEFKYITQVYEF